MELNDELLAKARAAKSPEELLALAQTGFAMHLAQKRLQAVH